MKNSDENGIDMEFLAIIISSVLSAIISYLMRSNGFFISILMGILTGIISGKIVHEIYRRQNLRG
jgi:uncharacterized membrane protein